MSRPAIHWTAEAWEDYLQWANTNKKLWQRINALIRDAQTTPFGGIGKPEPLRFELSGYWSRRIDHEHRLVYSFDKDNNKLLIAQCKFHYTSG